MIISINPENPQGRLLNRVAGMLADGAVIAYPTDTQYGLGCDLSQKKAIERIYRLKRRSRKSPFSIICADLTHISEYALLSNFAYRTLKRLLPGPFTFVLPGTRLVPQIMLTKRHEVGLRVPDHPVAVGLVQALGRPLINTSAKPAAPGPDPGGEPDEDDAAPEPPEAEEDVRLPLNPLEIEDMFKGAIDAVVDGGPVPGKPSTIVSLIDDDPVILRQGLGVF